MAQNTQPSIEIPEFVFFRRAFSVVVRMGREWRERNKITPEDIWLAGIQATLHIENCPQRVVGPCTRCCTGKKSSVQLSVTTFRPFGPHVNPNDPQREMFCFDNCKSFCSSSRLHFGGSLVLKLEFVRRSDGVLAYTATSLPFGTCSRIPRRMRSTTPSSSSNCVGVSPTMAKCPHPVEGVPVTIKLDSPSTENNSALTGFFVKTDQQDQDQQEQPKQPEQQEPPQRQNESPILPVIDKERADAVLRAQAEAETLYDVLNRALTASAMLELQAQLTWAQGLLQ